MSPAKTQIRNIFVIFISAFVCAGLIVGLMVRSWGTTGRYPLSSVLLAPDVLPRLAFIEMGANPGRMTFDRIEYRYFNAEQASWRVVPVMADVYERIYALMSDDVSLATPEEENAARFHAVNPSQLSIWVKPAGSSAAQSRILQDVHFSSDGSLYRVELRGQLSGQWVYFEHPGIQQAVRELVLTSP